jgi:hypothetical protein
MAPEFETCLTLMPALWSHFTSEWISIYHYSSICIHFIMHVLHPHPSTYLCMRMQLKNLDKAFVM